MTDNKENANTSGAGSLFSNFAGMSLFGGSNTQSEVPVLAPTTVTLVPVTSVRRPSRTKAGTPNRKSRAAAISDTPSRRKPGTPNRKPRAAAIPDTPSRRSKRLALKNDNTDDDTEA